jgi:serine/threonine-protein kinase
MDAMRWAKVEAIVAEALEQPAAGRGEFVRAACGGNPELYDEVQSLLDASDTGEDFLEVPLVNREAVPALGLIAPVDEQIGPWSVGRLLGRGGMGDVYLATRVVDGVTQQVALKVIRRGLESDEFIRRFRQERRILAQLNHPNVAQLLDVGVTRDGRPYFAMEYVDGVPLTQYCDQGRATVRERLRLFLAVLDAVEHAHQRLVVHRDLKPSNILVTSAGTPKLLDFGIGKVLSDPGDTDSAPETQTEARLLTPEYAAPEQVRGGYIGTTTDVYALGVVLYELLTGASPYVRAGMPRAQVEQAIVEATPLVPSDQVRHADRNDATRVAEARATDISGLSRRLAGDLDTMLLMALRKESDRRYPSAAAFALDIRRHLDGLPVSARPDTLGYRVRKFVGRNRAGVVGAVATAVALMGIAVTSAVQTRRLAAEAARTRAERDKAVEVRGFLMEMFGASGADRRIGDTVTVRALLDRQRAQLEQGYAGRDAVKSDMLEVLADGYDRLGLSGEAEPLAREALDLRRRVLPVDHPDLSASLNLFGWIIHQRGRSAEAEPLLLEAARMRRADSLRDPAALARTLNDLGVLYNAQRRYPEAHAVLREALVIRRAELGDSHRAVGITANNIAAAFYFQQQHDSAVAYQDFALKSLRAAVGEDHQRTIMALSNLAAFKVARGSFVEAEADYRELVKRQTRLQGRAHPITVGVLSSLAGTLTNRGQKERSDTILGEAESIWREVLVARQTQLGPSHSEVALAMHRLGTVRAARGVPREAVALQSRALALLRSAQGDTSQATRRVAQALASSWRLLGDSATATAVLRQFGIALR